MIVEAGVEERYAQETQAVQLDFERVHREVFRGYWLRRLLPFPALMRPVDFGSRAQSLRGLEERLRTVRLACLGAPEAGGDERSALELGTYADTLHAAVSALRRILERLQQRTEGVRYDMDEFAADIERYNGLIEAHRLRLSA